MWEREKRENYGVPIEAPNAPPTAAPVATRLAHCWLTSAICRRHECVGEKVRKEDVRSRPFWIMRTRIQCMRQTHNCVDYVSSKPKRLQFFGLILVLLQVDSLAAACVQD